jgi:hypothetical protein
VRDKPVQGRLGQERARPFAYRSRPVRAADDDQRKQRGPPRSLAQRDLTDPAVGVAESEGEFAVTGLLGPDAGRQRRIGFPAQPPPARRRVRVEQLRLPPGQCAHPEVKASPGLWVRDIDRLVQGNSGSQSANGLVRLVFAGQHRGKPSQPRAAASR